MHGLIFREFVLFAEDATSKGFVGDMIRSADPNGADDYDALGPYDENRLIAMMEFLGNRTGYDIPELCHDFGRRLFQRFTELHPELFASQTNAIDFLEGIEAHIHEQVRSLEPKSRPPRFDILRPAPNELVMHYQSHRPFADLCAGLIEGALDHYKENGQVDRRPVGDTNTEAVFTVTTSD